MNRLSIILIISLLNTFHISAQHYVYSDSITIVKNTTDTLSLAWSEGFNAPQWNAIDLNFDGKKDLVVFDREGGIIKPFLNISSTNLTGYKFAPEYRKNFPPSISQFLILKDYNCDGKEDIFTYVSGGMKVYKNVSTPATGIVFQQVVPLLYSQGNSGLINLYVAPTDIPAIEDIDNDGDLDILTYGVLGTTVEYHQNQSMELYGHCDSLIYIKVTNCWGNFSEGFSSYDITLNISCKGYDYPEIITPHLSQQKHSLHSGSSLLAMNFDGDSDKDLVVGDVSAKILIALTNGGDSSSAHITSIDTLFPNSQPVNMDIFPAGYYLDVDNDSIKDLIVSPNSTNTIENTFSAWYYKNIGTNNFPDFQYIQNDFLQSEMLDFGSASIPAVTDINQDGLPDIIVGNYGYYVNGNFEGKLAYLQNTGTLQNPSFKLITTDFANISIYNYLALCPTFGDLDNDGDNDMIIGENTGKLHYFENTSGAGNPANYQLSSSNYFGIDVGDNATPQLVDVDDDGLLDLLIGERGGTINYYRNYGTPTAPLFKTPADNDFFGNIDVMANCCTGFSFPHLQKNSTDTLLYVGSEFGKIYVYNHINGNLSGTFNLIDSIEIGANKVTFALKDLNNDTQTDLIVGEQGGGISFYTALSGLFLLSPDSGAIVNHWPKLDWSAVAGVSGYQLQIDTSLAFNSPMLKDTSFFYINASSYNTDTEYKTYNLLENTVYYWRVRTFTGPSYGNWTSAWTFTVDKTLNNSVKLPFAFTLFPNPAIDNIQIFSNEKITTVEIYDFTGNIVLQQIVNNHSTHIDISFLSKGVYFVKIENCFKKIIKM